MADYIPKWHRELGIFSRIKPVIILEGNVLDSYQYPEEGSTPKGSVLRLPEYLHFLFKDMGYDQIVFYDSLRGFYNNCEKGYLDSFAKLVKRSVSKGVIKSDFKGTKGDTAPGIVQDALSQTESPAVVIMNFASRYITSPDNMDHGEVDSFTLLQQASLEGREVKNDQGTILKNLLVLVTSKVNDLPAWFYLNDPNVKIISLSSPAREEREALVKGPNFPSFFATNVYQTDIAYYDEHPSELEKVQDRFVALTDGMSFTEINGLRRLAKTEHVRIRDLCDVIDLYKYGIRENPWKKLDLDLIRNGKQTFEKRVKGQESAITKTLDVIKRAITGMSGLQGSSHTRPKGVLFFAGPTGTGKTETAKALAEMLFGADDCCKRFDMSEYGQSHSDQKLLGAPPGYVGYEAGGQLTNAAKKDPFSIFLFDEIEKAHPSVLDKFLQILEDGRMTDGHGNTVHFSESIIIFTSNLGIYTMDEFGRRSANVTSDMPYAEVSARVREAVEDYFKLQLGRPEILNRIGENIVVFDFIRPDTAEHILSSQVKRITGSLLAEKNIQVELSPGAYGALQDCAVQNLSNGGRGIGNVVENLLINPLARYLFDSGIFEDMSVRIDGLDLTQMPPALRCTKLQGSAGASVRLTK